MSWLISVRLLCPDILPRRWFALFVARWFFFALPTHRRVVDGSEKSWTAGTWSRSPASIVPLPRSSDECHSKCEEKNLCFLLAFWPLFVALAEGCVWARWRSFMPALLLLDRSFFLFTGEPQQSCKAREWMKNYIKQTLFSARWEKKSIDYLISFLFVFVFVLLILLHCNTTLAEVKFFPLSHSAGADNDWDVDINIQSVYP